MFNKKQVKWLAGFSMLFTLTSVNAAITDTDLDGYSDELEVLAGTNPNLDTSTPIDTDLDGVIDWIEQVANTDVHSPCTPANLSIENNLLLNASFESSADKWQTDNGFTMNAHQGPVSGDAFLVGGNTANGVTYQVVDLTCSGVTQSILNQGLYNLDFGGYQSSYANSDTGQLELVFRDADWEVVSSVSLEAFKNTQVWELFSSELAIPVTAKFAQFNFKAVRYRGAENSAYLDDAYLNLTPSDIDNDVDGMTDWHEIDFFGDLTRDGTGDFDNDGVTDLDEFNQNTNPTLEDTDNDGFNDKEDVFPLDATRWADTDGDGLDDAEDVDADGDGIVDADAYERNLLSNADFSGAETSWTVLGAQFPTLTNKDDIESEMVAVNYDYSARNDSIEQTVTFADVGFSDENALQQALANNSMKLVFGGWHATWRVDDYSTRILVTFKDENGEAIGLPTELSDAGTGANAWKKRIADVVVPVNARSVTYRVEFKKPRDSGYRVLFDDAFMYLQLATDVDSDGVLDEKDVDLDNDGIVDATAYETNLLSNPDFSNNQTSWTVLGAQFPTLTNKDAIESEMVAVNYDYSARNDSIEQTVTFADVGFSDENALQQALANNSMKLVFGGWHATWRVDDNSTRILVIFKDENGEAIGLPTELSDAGTGANAWNKRIADVVVPVNARSVTYRVELKKPRESGYRALFDDAFVFLVDIRDDDNDGLSNIDEQALGTDPNKADTDGDSIKDGADAFPFDNTEWGDNDLDGIGNNADLDDDNDGIEDTLDAFPFDANESVDTDGDGVGNNADTDKDGDNVDDALDEFPLDSTESVDTDGDGTGNNADIDDDNDGIVDADDTEPLNDKVGDVQAPVISRLEALTIEATGPLTTVELVEPEVTDNNLNLPTISNDLLGELNLGEHSVTWTAVDYAGNTATGTQLVTIVDTTAPSFTAMEVVTVNATGLLNDIKGALTLTAFDSVDGEVIANGQFNESYYSGLHKVIFTSVDNSNNKSSFEQEVHILPLVNMGIDKVVTSGENATFEVLLSGKPAQYPVTVEYYLSGSAVDSSSGELAIEEGLTATLDVSILDSASLNDNALLTLVNANNAVLSDNNRTTFNVVDGNYAPIVSLTAYQNGGVVNAISPDDGLVTVVAVVRDINASDEHSFSWTSMSAGVVDNSNDNLVSTFEFSPEALNDGVYGLSIKVTENNTVDELFTEQFISLVAIGSRDELSDVLDSDSDLIADKEEGYADSDNDGIPDYLDDNSNRSLLPWKSGQLPIETHHGLKLSLGGMVVSSKSIYAKYAALTMSELALFAGIDNTVDYHFESSSEMVNFNVTGLSLSGDSVTVVVPVENGKMISEQATYRIYNTASGWNNFSLDDGNVIASALRDSIGNCPPPGSVVYTVGLTPGHSCIQFTIVDGGNNDADGNANGKVGVVGVLSGELENSLPVFNFPLSYSFDEESNITVDASATTDAEYDDLTFDWVQTSGQLVSITDTQSKVLSFSSPSVSKSSTLTFKLTVFDGYDSTAEIITVMINHVNKAPSVVINEHEASVNETESLTLTPTVTEPDGDPVTYMWEQTSGPTVTLIDADKASVEVVMPEVASDSSIEIKLTISDGEYSKSVVTSIDIINVEPIQTAPPNQEKESSGGGGTMGWMLLLMIMISFRHLRFVKW